MIDIKTERATFIVKGPYTF